jgi:GT2 family glycosyltransferase
MTDRELIESLLAKQEQLERSLQETRRALSEALDRQRDEFDRIDMRLGQVQARASMAFQETRNILNSRIWKALVQGGGLLLRANNAVRNVRHLKRGSGKQEFRVVCEEPSDYEPRSGTIEIRGWAISSEGIDRVMVNVGDAPPLEARYGIYRPDVARSYPDIPKAERCGFIVRFDTMSLINGRHAIVIRAHNRRGEICEQRMPLMVDHLRGFPNDYARWIAEFDQRDEDLIKFKLESFRTNPLISILMPVYKTDPRILERTLKSVLTQSYGNWELCVVDDCSRSTLIDDILQRYAADARIRIVRHTENKGISSASNTALEMARGEYAALLDHDDELAQDALFHVVDALQQTPEADILYSDEDHTDEFGVRTEPFFKPDWSPNLILSENYVCHLMVFRRELALNAGGFRREADVSQDHDILLRMSLKAQKIVHIPKILYHWRTNLEVSTRASESRDKVLDSSRGAVENYLRLAGIEATVEPGRVPGRWRVRYPINDKPEVSIIIPSGGRLDVLERNLDTLASITDYPNFEIVVIDNSKSAVIEKFAGQWKKNGRTVRYIDWRNRPFNYSEINNAAAKSCESPLLLFLNDDTCAIDPGWLTAMVEIATRAEVGAVGARLLFPDGRIQHGGVVMGIFGICGHAFKGTFGDEPTYFDFPDVIRDVSALTAACLLVPAKVFWEVGGFDEVQFPVAYNDIDLSLKIGAKGYRLVYTPHASLYHFEAFSKTAEDLDPRPAETAALRTKWKDIIARDPFYNPNLTVTAEDFSLRKRA